MTNLWTNVEDLGDYAESDYAYDAVKTASFILWALSGRKFSGTTTVTERYVTMYDDLGVGGEHTNLYNPALIGGEVYNLPSGRFGSGVQDDLLGDGTSSNSRVRLRGRKVVAVHALRDLDGNIIDPSQYYLGDHSTVYGSKNSSWSPAAVEVTYTYGSPPPTAGKAAARILANELVKMYENDDTCALPQRVTSVTRQGVSFTILDDQTFIDELKTGLYSVDLFLKAVNPDKARARARVFSPDTPRARRITGKSKLLPESSLDLYVGTNGGANLIYLTDINGSFLIGAPEWVLSAEITSWGDDRTAVLETAPILNELDGTITVVATYAETLAILGPIDPGTIDIYATRPSLGNPLIPEIVTLTTFNASIRLGQPVTPIYTA
jgi:hypothetical protein